jgi:hypothetical protein
MSSISSAISPATLPSATNSGLATISNGSRMLNQDARQIANPGNQSLTAPLVNLSQSNLVAEAGADVIRTANQMLGSLLDIFA